MAKKNQNKSPEKIEHMLRVQESFQKYITNILQILENIS